ncbi:MAG: CocE/NonD family hydrolase [Alistipes sp.]
MRVSTPLWPPRADIPPKAASPQAPVTDWFMGDDTHHNGVLFLRDAFSFIGGSFGRPMNNPTAEAVCSTPLRPHRRIRFLSAQGHRRQLDAAWATPSASERDDASSRLRRLVARTLLGACHARLRPAILVVGGLFDAEDCYGAWTTYASIRRQSPARRRMVAGPWVHGGWRSSNGGNRSARCASATRR